MVKLGLMAFTSHGLQPEQNLKEALHLLKDFAEIRKLSSVFKSIDDVRSLRVVAKITVHVPLEMLITYISEMEGRFDVSVKLLMLEEEVMLRPEMPVPDPDLHETAHWLVPSSELWPEAQHPVLKKSLKTLSTQLPNRPWGEFVAQGKTLLDFSE